MIKKIDINNLNTRTTIVFILVISLHVFNIPLWVSLVSFSLIAWHIWASWTYSRKYKNKTFKYNKKQDWIMSFVFNTIGLIFFTLIVLNFKSLGFLVSATAHLVIMMSLQLNETRRLQSSKRKHMILALAMYFILLTHFIFSQSMWMVIYLFINTLLITILLIDINHNKKPLSLKEDFKIASNILILALPIMIILFILFPRVSGPVWGIKQLSGEAKTGLTDSMSPGDISELILSHEPVFRVNFKNNKMPPQNKLYWRGFVLDKFNGDTWYRSVKDNHTSPIEASYKGEFYNYDIILEPQGESILFSLDIPSIENLPKETTIKSDFELMNDSIVSRKKLYSLQSATKYTLQSSLTNEQKEKFLKLPDNSNPKTKALAKEWKNAGLNDVEIINKALKRYRQENFIYTLSPTKLGNNSIDEFLFKTQQGFCEHYSSSFSFLLRAAGIPTRVVVGYQGGDINNIGDYLIVRQSNAHAWNEVWLENQGWVRFDPTSAVSPDRIEQGSINNAFNDPDAAQYYNTINNQQLEFLKPLTNALDWVNNSWNHWFLGYNKEKQKDLLSYLGISNMLEMIATLIISIISIFILMFIGLYILNNRIKTDEQAVIIWNKLLKKLKKKGIYQNTGESSSHFINRIIEYYPEKKQILYNINSDYIKIRYENNTEGDKEKLEKRMLLNIKNI